MKAQPVIFNNTFNFTNPTSDVNTSSIGNNDEHYTFEDDDPSSYHNHSTTSSDEKSTFEDDDPYYTYSCNSTSSSEDDESYLDQSSKDSTDSSL